MEHFFVLPVPWAHCDMAWRKKLGPNELAEVDAGTPLHLVAPVGAEIELSGHRMGVQPEGLPYDLDNARCRRLTASIGTRPEDDQIEVTRDGIPAGSICIRGHQPRPGWTARWEGGAPHDLWAERLDHFLLRLIDLIRIADDPKLQHHQGGWERLSAAWSDERPDPSEPPIALIVRHAVSMRALVADLAGHPRHILRRTRDMTPVDRVQQIDISCIRWLSRQPGTTWYERAGPRQRIMAVQRYENRDTLENRILRDFCHRSSGIAAAYAKRYEGYSKSKRRALVERYGRECRRYALDLEKRGVSTPHPPLIPNYVLLQDPRYRKLWAAYIELLRRLDEEDECWRWQHRLWSDFCRLALHVALRRSAGRDGTVAESPLRLLPEQQRGQWSVVDAQSAVFLLETGAAGKIVVSLLWDTAAGHPKLPPGLAGLGATSVLHAQSLATGKEAYVLMWPVHFVVSDGWGIAQLVESAHRANNDCGAYLRMVKSLDLAVGGLILKSGVTPDDEEAAHLPEGAPRIAGLRLTTSPEHMTVELERVSRASLALIKGLLRG